jgi:hypothetical protein
MNIHKMDLMKWPLFSLLEPDFVYKIKMACVYGMYYSLLLLKIHKRSQAMKSEYILLPAGGNLSLHLHFLRIYICG